MIANVAKAMDNLSVALITTTLFPSDAVQLEAKEVQNSLVDFMNGVRLRTVIPSDRLEKLPTPSNRQVNAPPKVP